MAEHVGFFRIDPRTDVDQLLEELESVRMFLMHVREDVGSAHRGENARFLFIVGMRENLDNQV